MGVPEQDLPPDPYAGDVEAAAEKTRQLAARRADREKRERLSKMQGPMFPPPS
jgi:hypothetical protein